MIITLITSDITYGKNPVKPLFISDSDLGKASECVFREIFLETNCRMLAVTWIFYSKPKWFVPCVHRLLVFSPVSFSLTSDPTSFPHRHLLVVFPCRHCHRKLLSQRDNNSLIIRHSEFVCINNFMELEHVQKLIFHFIMFGILQLGPPLSAITIMTSSSTRHVLVT